MGRSFPPHPRGAEELHPQHFGGGAGRGVQRTETFVFRGRALHPVTLVVLPSSLGVCKRPGTKLGMAWAVFMGMFNDFYGFHRSGYLMAENGDA